MTNLSIYEKNSTFTYIISTLGVATSWRIFLHTLESGEKCAVGAFADTLRRTFDATEAAVEFPARKNARPVRVARIKTTSILPKLFMKILLALAICGAVACFGEV